MSTTYVILDLEWNGSYSKKAKGYFNEIIEIGAVRLSSNGEIADRFDAYIRPVVGKKLTKIVTNLTGITDEQVGEGGTFTGAISRLKRFVGSSEVVLMTWSTTDFLVLMENCRYFFGDAHVPFFTAYLDLQAYAQQRMGLGTSQQVGLAKCAELLSLDSADMELHHAIDDSVLSAKIFRRVYDRKSLEKAVLPIDEEFYRRITFRVSYISDINSPSIRRSDLRFSCDACGRNLKRTGNWKSYHHAFTAPFHCPSCNVDFYGRVQARQRYEGVELKKRLLRKKEESVSEETVPQSSNAE